MASPTTDETTARGPRPRRRHLSRSTSRRRERRQLLEPESDAESVSGSEDDSESDSEDENGPPPRSRPSSIRLSPPSPILPPPSPVLPPLSPPPQPALPASPTVSSSTSTTSLGAIATFRVDKGGVVASPLPDDNANVQPPLNVIIPGAEPAEPAEPVPISETESVLSTTLVTVTASATATTTTTQSTFTDKTRSSSRSSSSAWPTDVDMEFNRKGNGEVDIDRSGDTARHVMIGGGSIGAFIAVCLIGWLSWRIAKARRMSRRDGSPWRNHFLGAARRPNVLRQARVAGALGKIPWVKNQPWAQKWQTLGDDDALFPGPAEKFSSQDRPHSAFKDRPHSVFSAYSSVAPYHDGVSEKGVAKVAHAVSLKRVVVPQIDTTSPPQQAASPLGAAVMGAAVVASHQYQPQPSSSPPGAQDGGTWVYVSPSQARPDSDPFADVQRRDSRRDSSLTSLSSGFGDGAMIFAAGAAGAAVPQPPRPSASRAGSSVMGGASSNRDTVYTQTSDDPPTNRFRTVSSWVNQQKGRVYRAQQRLRDGSAVPGGGGGGSGDGSGGGLDEGIPPVPGIPAGTGAGGMPPEPRMSMMMSDGEVPRRVDTEGLMGGGR